MINVPSVIDKVIQLFNPEKIYLFGSYARGSQNEESDLDMLIIDDRAEAKSRSRDLAFEISLALYPRDFHLDLLTYTAKNFQKKLAENDPLIHQIIKEGTQVYERSGN